MLEYLTLPVSACLGFLAGLGVGGGSLLMLWLTLIVGMDYTSARIVNMLFFLPSAVITTLFRRKQGAVPIKKILPAIIAGCAVAALFSYIGKYINTDLLKKIFGGLLLFTGLRELFYLPRKAK
jgi:uncharacterized membrane protein YfcA